MKVGETKRFLISDANGKDLILQRVWKTFNRNIVTIDTDFVDDEHSLTEYIEFTANAVGTVAIRGRMREAAAIDRYNGFEMDQCPGDINITVTVTKASTKMTAAQKKCKHSWKVTRKSTCQRFGEKVCKKCRLKKSIKKTDHKWETTTMTVPVVEDIVFEVWYHIDYEKDRAPFMTIKLSDYATAEEIAHAHFTETANGYDITGVSEEAENAFLKAVYEVNFKPVYGMREVYSGERTTETVTSCEYCHTTK